jgi:hypothetical protein
MAKKKPGSGEGLLGWLGRQVGHVRKAIKTDVTSKPPPPKQTVVYRDDKIEEAAHPTEPGVKLRRTVIDEVIVDEPAKRIK